jgi:leukotriene-A4 hydrolase
MYSLCQLNYCRDLAPMMDTPSVKVTYDATVLAPSEMTVAMSANETASMEFNATHTTTMFNCTIKLPSYLIAIVVGDLAKQSLSDRVSVLTEPSLLERAAEEFAELPDALAIAEEYLTPYIWGTYTIVIMPPRYVCMCAKSGWLSTL